jgi:hypothetical protein
MSDFLTRAKEAIRKKSKKAKKVLVKKALQYAELHTPVDKGNLKASVREVEVDELTSFIVWGDDKTMTDSGIGYEYFVAFGTKFQASQLYHVRVGRLLAREFKGIKIGAVASVTASKRKPISVRNDRQLAIV